MKEPLTLTGLVEASLVVCGARSVLQLSAFARRHDQPITYTTQDHIRSGTYKSLPSAKTVRPSAWLAGVDDAVAFRAAGRSIPNLPLADDLPLGADGVLANSRKAAIVMVKVMIDLERANHERHSAGHSPNRDTVRRTAVLEDGPVAGKETHAVLHDDFVAHHVRPQGCDQIDCDLDVAGENMQDHGEGAA